MTGEADGLADDGVTPLKAKVSATIAAPAVLADDFDDGFLLLTDLGTRTYLAALDVESANALYADALEPAGLGAQQLAFEQLKVRLAAPPEKGAANRELIDFLARSLNLPKSSFKLTAGASSRSKVVAVDDLSPDLPDRLCSLVPASKETA